MTSKVSDNIISGMFKYKDGKVTEFLAEHVIKGNRLELTNIAFYPQGVNGNQLKNAFGGRAMLETFEAMQEYARSNGFKEIRIHFIRGLKSSSANPGKVFDRIFKL